MILIGQYDSPFVRRVAIAMTLYGLAFEHRPWSVFGDAEKIKPYNPLLRVPTLVLADGEALIESHSILDYLDSLAPPGAALFPASGPARRKALQVTALATGAAEKAVSLFYELRLHEAVSEVWVKRCGAQISGALAALEADRAGRGEPYWLGETIGHADISVAAALRFIGEAHAERVSLNDFPALRAHALKLEALPVFQAVRQPFLPPA